MQRPVQRSFGRLNRLWKNRNITAPGKTEEQSSTTIDMVSFALKIGVKRVRVCIWHKALHLPLPITWIMKIV